MAEKQSIVQEIAQTYDSESRAEKLARKSKDAPYMPIGIAVALASVAYGALKFKNRGKMSPSIYFIHMRMAAQGAVVSALTIGVSYTLLRDYIFTGSDKKESSQ